MLKKDKILKIMFYKYLFILFILLLIQSGCSDDPSTAFQPAVPTPTPASIYPSADEVLAQYFTQEEIQQMRNDAAPLIKQYGGINIFSSAQYGRKFITGTANIKDVFDARIPQNYEIFKKYAWDNFGEKNAYYARYAEAANAFIKEFEYDAVLFHPDELHPVFTDSVNDTWILLRDAPTNELDIYYSSRVINREITITGGMEMVPLSPDEFLGVSHWMYYIPAEGSNYIAYTPGDINIASIPKFAIGPSNYVPVDASPDAINKRNLYGIIPSNLSNRQVKVGGWKNEEYIEDMVNNGISFSNNPEGGSWGGWGLYLIPLEKDFWE